MAFDPHLSWSDLGILEPIDPHEITSVRSGFEDLYVQTEKEKKLINGQLVVSLVGVTACSGLGSLYVQNEGELLRVDQVFVTNLEAPNKETSLHRYDFDRHLPRVMTTAAYTMEPGSRANLYTMLANILPDPREMQAEELHDLGRIQEALTRARQKKHFSLLSIFSSH
jgi:hypothetical protein